MTDEIRGARTGLTVTELTDGLAAGRWTEPTAPEITIPSRRGRYERVPTFWTPEIFDTVKKLWLEGNSASMIARTIGSTRNAIIGKLMRNGMRRGEGAPRGGGLADASKVKRIARKASKAIKLGPELCDLPSAQPDNPMSFMQLDPRHCRWPCSGEGIDVVFCGGNALPSHSYCARHCRMSYEPPKRRRQPAKVIYFNRNGAAR